MEAKPAAVTGDGPLVNAAIHIQGYRGRSALLVLILALGPILAALTIFGAVAITAYREEPGIW